MSQLEAVTSRFSNFLYLVWLHLSLPAPTPLQYEIADFMQYGPRRAMVQAFRGIGKSWIAAVFCLWLLLNDPQIKILVVSASKDRADAFVKFVKQVMDSMPLLAHLRPMEGQLDRADMFDVAPALPAQAPSLKAVGITGQMTGSRADVIIPDDVEVPKNSLTQLMRDRLSEAIKEFDSILTTNRDKNRILYLGTPQTEMSIYAGLADRGFITRTWTARYPDAERMERMQAHLAPSILAKLQDHPELVGQATDTRFSLEDLIEREASYGRSGFALQFMLDTTVSDADRYPLKLSDLIVLAISAIADKMPVTITYGSSPDQVINDLEVVGLTGDRWYRPMYISKADEWADIKSAIMFIDPSGRGSDETSYAVIKYHHGMLICTASGGFKDGYSPATLDALAGIAKSHKVNSCIVEPNYGGGMFNELFKPVVNRVYAKCAVEDAPWSKGQKEMRIIDTLEPIMNQHRLVFVQEVIEADIVQAKDDPKFSLFYQMTRLTKDRGALAHDDRIEALAGGCAYWVESMARDQQQAEDKHKEALRDQELKKFMEQVLGGPKTPNTLMRTLR